jgi:hypothetical protein
VGETLKTVQELIDESPVVDVTDMYDQWRAELEKLMGKVRDRFELTQDPSTKGLEVEGEIGSGIHGQVQCFAGPEIDWLVYSWMADPVRGFANLHLTISPGAQNDLPVFGMAFANFGIRPWSYIDLLPRRDMAVDTDYYFKYYDSGNQHWLDIKRDNPQFDWFTSPTAYIRNVVSPNAFLYSGPFEQRTTDVMIAEAHYQLDRWLGWWDDEPREVPVEERPAFGKYTEDLRRTIAVLDPANDQGERLFGSETTDLLVATLWGRDRELPHAGW